MPFLSPSNIVCWFDFGAMPFSQLFVDNLIYLGANKSGFLANWAPPQLRGEADLLVGGRIQDGNIYRQSLGRYLKLESTPGLWALNTFADPQNIAIWQQPAFTIAAIFRPRRVTGAEQLLFSKRLSSITETDNFSMRLSLSGTTLRWVGQSVGVNDVSIASACGINDECLAYVSKAAGNTNANIGIKVKSGAWKTATTAVPITTTFNSAADFWVNAQLAFNGSKELLGDIDYSELCHWNTAIAPATLQSSLEDHFGIADVAGGGGTRSQSMRRVAARRVGGGGA